MKAFAIVALAAPALSAAIPRIELDMAEEPTMSANKWCNGDKTFVSGMESKKYSGTDECIGLCRNNDACEWVGYRKYDKYCEFWTSGSCQNPHDQSGHDIYHVTTSTKRKKRRAKNRKGLRVLCEVSDEWEKLGRIRHQRTT